jgi:hypothetical protein
MDGMRLALFFWLASGFLVAQTPAPEPPIAAQSSSAVDINRIHIIQESLSIDWLNREEEFYPCRKTKDPVAPTAGPSEGRGIGRGSDPGAPANAGWFSGQESRTSQADDASAR